MKKTLFWPLFLPDLISMLLSENLLVFWPNLNFLSSEPSEPKLWFNYVRAIQYHFLEESMSNSESKMKTGVCEMFYSSLIQVKLFTSANSFEERDVKWTQTKHLLRFVCHILFSLSWCWSERFDILKIGRVDRIYMSRFLRLYHTCIFQNKRTLL